MKHAFAPHSFEIQMTIVIPECC